MEQYSFLDWDKQNGTVPVTWKPEDYINIPWAPLDTKLVNANVQNLENPPFWTDGKNFERYQGYFQIGNYVPDFEKISQGSFVPDSVDKIFGPAVRSFHLDNMVYAFAKYAPGQILPWHQDGYPTYRRNNNAELDEVVRIMVFLHDPAPGHQLWIEDKLCDGPAGSWYAWQGDTTHMAANLAEVDRYVIQITGKNPYYKKK